MLAMPCHKYRNMALHTEVIQVLGHRYGVSTYVPTVNYSQRRRLDDSLMSR